VHGDQAGAGALAGTLDGVGTPAGDGMPVGDGTLAGDQAGAGTVEMPTGPVTIMAIMPESTMVGMAATVFTPALEVDTEEPDLTITILVD